MIGKENPLKTLLKGFMQLLGELIVMILLLPIVAPVACWLTTFPPVMAFYNAILTVIDNLISIFMA